MKKQIYKSGDKVGSMIFIKELPLRVQPSGKIKRMALMECECGNIEKAHLYSVIDGSKIRCRPCGLKVTAQKNFKHGLIHHKVYSIWADIKKRCYNKNHKAFKNYGSKGITMFSGWIDNVKAFYDYVTELSGYDEKKLGIKNLTIDRIDGTIGYFPNNLRWARGGLQNYNKGLQVNNKTGLKGISERAYGTFQVMIGVKKKRQYIGTFKTIEQAKDARDNYLRQIGIFDIYTKYETEIVSKDKTLNIF